MEDGLAQVRQVRDQIEKAVEEFVAAH
jgi:hypothetical protein